jgi:hypothetical protein
MRALVLLMATLITGSGQPLPKQPGDYTPAAQSRVVTWNLKRVPPPSPVYVDVDDNLVVNAASLVANELVTVNYRVLRAADGVIVRQQLTVKPLNSNGGIGQQVQPLAEGFLLSLSVSASQAQTRGQTFVRIFIGSGAFGAGAPSYQLMADYVTNQMAPGFPNGRVVSPVEGPGWIHTRTQNNPTAGHDWGITSQPPGRFRIVSLTAALTTSAVGGNRAVFLQLLNDSATTAGLFYSGVGQAPSVAVTYTWSSAPVATQTTGSSVVPVGIPVLGILKAPESVQSQTAGIAAGDQWSFITMIVEEWLDNV